MKPRVLVTGRIPDAVLRTLAAECEVDIHTDDSPIARQDLIDRVRDKHALVCQITETIDRDILEAAPDLRVIANIAVGYNNIDVAEAQRRGLIVTNTPDVLTEATADFAFGLMLAATRRIPEAERVVRRGDWKVWKIDFMLGTELRTKQLGIVGFGRIGRAVAARSRAFGMRVVFADEVVITADGAKQVPLNELLATSDVVSLHLAFTPSATHLINETTLRLMKPTAFLINTSRGSVVDEAALAAALREGRLAGAALDVFEEEPRIHPDLASLENVVLTPHIGSASVETRTNMIKLAVDNALAVLQGRTPLTPVPNAR